MPNLSASQKQDRNINMESTSLLINWKVQMNC